MKFANKKGFLLRDVAIAAVFGTGIIALFVLVISSMAVNYGRTDIVNPSFSQHYNQLERLTGSLEQSRNAVTNSSSGLSLLGTFSVTFNSFFTVVQLVWDSLNIWGTQTASVMSDYTFLSPAASKIVFVILLAGLTISIIFIIISSVTRGRV